MIQPTPVRVWVDPSCPWAWQTSLWLRDIRDRGLIELTWSIFSLELNAADPDTPFWEACTRHGGSLVALELARREGGIEAFEALYGELGARMHERKEERTDEQVHEAARHVGMADLPDQARHDPDVTALVVDEYMEARAQDVFGVPTLKIDLDKVIFGPLVAVPPQGDDAVSLWEQTKGLSGRPDFFELKRWPRDLRPGGASVGLA